MSKGIDGPRRVGLKGAPSTGTVEGRQRSLARNNRMSNGYPMDGTPADALCKEGEYDKMTKGGKYYDAKNGPDRWDAKMRGKKMGY